MALADRKAEKKLEIMGAAESAYAKVWSNGGLAHLNRDYALMLGPLAGRAVSPEIRTQMNAAMATVEKMRQKLSQVDAAATEEEVNKVQW